MATLYRLNCPKLLSCPEGKKTECFPLQSDELWCGAHNTNGKVGYFSPANTVAYLGTLPTSHHSQWQNEELHSGGGSGGSSHFQRNSLKRSSKVSDYNILIVRLSIKSNN